MKYFSDLRIFRTQRKSNNSILQITTRVYFQVPCRGFSLTPMSEHIPVSLLFEYSRNSDVLEFAHLDHLESCEDCVAILWLSRTSESLEHLKSRLKKHDHGE